MDSEDNQKSKPFKICNNSREIRKGIVASSLDDLTSKVQEKLELVNDNNFTVVLEADGTEIDDEEYFATLEPNTSLMVLADNQKWSPPYPKCDFSRDQVDDARELELLSDMDPDSLADLTYPDKIFLDQLKEASGRFLSEKRQAQDAMDLLRLYQEKEAAESEAN
ncbi:cell death activator CIDE-3-like isoform X2 [Sitophilus oryzae]|uniref:Cell death activator CIDE-3-like isoform X2 n=1 Tax=Sitophilus oryzae TaxID=7048 RepID=A0A6J2Y3Q2_SITOR|nr:cell death activator CIDE-3-like isoform X2 [Sitophilus oryzae]